MKKTIGLLMIITILSKTLGFAREISLSFFYGASSISDAYLISMIIPTVIFSFIGVGITTGYIPMYSKIQKSQGEEEGNNFTNNLINVLLVICSIIIIIGFLFTSQIVKIFAPGFGSEALKLGIKFTKISLFGIYFTVIVSIFSGFLQLKNNYIAPAVIGFISNVFIILAVIISAKTNVIFLPVGSVLAIASQLIFLRYSTRKNGFKYKLIFNLNDKYIINMAQIALPLIIGISVNQINVLVDQTIASRVAVGGISALNYSDRINSFALSTVVMSISVSIYPLLSKMAADDNIIELKKIISQSISAINLLLIPATISTMCFARPIVSILLGRGAFGNSAINMTSYALFYYSLGMIGVALREILSRAFYSMQDTKTPMINAGIAVILNIILSLLLSKFIGIGGPALATSISAMFCTGLLFINLRKKIGPFGMKKITISFIKILCASLVMGFIAKLSYNYLLSIISSNLALLMAILIIILTYLVFIYFMKIEDVQIIVATVRKKLKKNTANEC